ncbi:hypothetical protein LOTGIDRAFT_175253 [Lottia gigantea]|uniref:Uncharacterized protein n=1 Tax=Lottia gigantea TaxID=225164 RepID=V3ZUL2_LOTGI|nr:hypothetical protein LOTGIDRAFT_175253 [Lottia gigantea]ESO95178.1 hypothetical protein LOTGIDRAFT_175253 [Lottia gigantea]
MARDCPMKILRRVETENKDKDKSYADALSGFSASGDKAVEEQTPGAGNPQEPEVMPDLESSPRPTPTRPWAEEMDSELSNSDSDSLIIDVQEDQNWKQIVRYNVVIHGYFLSVSTRLFVYVFWQGTPNFTHYALQSSELFYMCGLVCVHIAYQSSDFSLMSVTQSGRLCLLRCCVSPDTNIRTVEQAKIYENLGVLALAAQQGWGLFYLIVYVL